MISHNTNISKLFHVYPGEREARTHSRFILGCETKELI